MDVDKDVDLTDAEDAAHAEAREKKTWSRTFPLW